MLTIHPYQDSSYPCASGQLRKLLCVAIFLVSGSIGSAHADVEPPHCRYVNLAAVPIKFVNHNPTIEARVDGIPYPITFGTATTVSWFDLKAATDHGLIPEQDVPDSSRYLRLHGNDGQSSAFYRVVSDISIGNMHTSRTAILVLVDSKLAETGGGQLGVDVLFQKDVEFWFANNQIKYFEPHGCSDAFLAYWDDNATFVDMRKMWHRDRRAIVQVEINGQPMRATIDSSRLYSAIDLQAAARLGVTPGSPDVVESKTHNTVGQKTVKQWVAPFESFSIGTETIRNPKIHITDLIESGLSQATTLAGENDLLDHKVDMELGTDFLQAHRVLFAVSQQRLYFSYLGGEVFAPEIEPASTAETIQK
jgi:hypothetical protein